MEPIEQTIVFHKYHNGRANARHGDSRDLY